MPRLCLYEEAAAGGCLDNDDVIEARIRGWLYVNRACGYAGLSRMHVGSLTRRDLLRLAGLGTVGLVAGCEDTNALKPGSSHAAIVLEPDTDSFLVAVWAAAARTVAIEVRVGDSVVFTTTAQLDSERRVAAIDVTGLAPGEHHQVSIVADDGVQLGPYHVRTAPRADDTRPARIAVSADIDPHPEFASDLLDHLAGANPELFVSLGDFPYADNGPGPAMTVEQFRERHLEVRTEPRIRQWLETVGVRAIYDDHEFRNDWDGMYQIVEETRFRAAMQVWDEFFPLRGAADTDVRYRSWRWGAHLECFLLDCRRFRSPNATPDTAEKSMLGATQRAWLVDGIKRSTATFKVVFTSVPLDFGDGIDHWAGFTVERNAMLAALLGVPGVLFISADQHVFAAHRHAYGVREFQVGPLCRGVGAPLRTAPGVLFRAARFNFALIDVDADALVVSGVGAGGEVFYKETLTAVDLTPSGTRL